MSISKLIGILENPEEITILRAAELEISKKRIQEILKGLEPEAELKDTNYRELKKQAMLLRRQGHKLITISKMIGVAPSTISKWAKGPEIG